MKTKMWVLVRQAEVTNVEAQQRYSITCDECRVDSLRSIRMRTIPGPRYTIPRVKQQITFSSGPYSREEISATTRTIA